MPGILSFGMQEDEFKFFRFDSQDTSSCRSHRGNTGLWRGPNSRTTIVRVSAGSRQKIKFSISWPQNAMLERLECTGLGLHQSRGLRKIRRQEP